MGAARYLTPLCRTTRALMTTRRALAGRRTRNLAIRPRPSLPVPLPRDAPLLNCPALADARRTWAARLRALRPEPAPRSLPLPGRTRKSWSSVLMIATQAGMPPADPLKTRDNREIVPPAAWRCHLKIPLSYNHIGPTRWRPFYLAIDKPHPFQPLEHLFP